MITVCVTVQGGADRFGVFVRASGNKRAIFGPRVVRELLAGLAVRWEEPSICFEVVVVDQLPLQLFVTTGHSQLQLRLNSFSIR